MTQDPQPSSTAAWTWAVTALPAFTAVGLATLYALGIVVVAGELTASRYSPQDVMPLVPLQQLLARGFSVIVDPVVILVAFALAGQWVAAYWTLSDSDQDRRWRAKQVEVRRAAIRQVEVVLTELEQRGENLPPIAQARQELARAEEALINPSRHDFRVAVTRTVAAADMAVSLADRVGHETAATADLRATMTAEWRPHTQRRQSVGRVGVLLLSVALLVMLLVVDLAAAPYIWLLLVGFSYVIFRVHRGRPLTAPQIRRVLPLFLMVYAVGQAYLGARPLQRAEIPVSDGTIVRGEVLINPGPSGGEWYLGQEHDVIRVVRGSDAPKVRLYRPADAKTRFSDSSLLDLLSAGSVAWGVLGGLAALLVVALVLWPLLRSPLARAAANARHRISRHQRRAGRLLPACRRAARRFARGRPG